MSETKLLSISQVEKKTSLHEATIYKWMASGKFPKSIKLSSRKSAWHSRHIDAWIDNLAEEQGLKSQGAA